MLGRSSEGSVSSEGHTQTGFTKVNIDSFVDTFIDHGKEFAVRRGSGLEEKCEAKIRVFVRPMAEERGREKVFTFLRSTVEKDQASKVTEFYVAWCQLTSVLDENEQSAWQVAGIRLALDILCSQPLFTFVANLHDQFVKQVQLCDRAQILSLLETHSETLKASDLSSRWTDCSLVLLRQLLRNEEITKDGNVMKSDEFVRELLYKWMIQAATFDVFAAVVTVVQNLSMSDLIEKFLDEQHLQTQASDLLIEDRRPVLTWKCINLMRVADNKRLARVLREVITAWPKKKCAQPTPELMSSVHEMVKVAQSHQNVGKACADLLKPDPGAMMCSEFGFLLVFALCSIDRYKAATISELTKVFQRLWNFRENLLESGWIEGSGLGEVVNVVEDQVNCLVQRLGEDMEAWELLSNPTVTLMQSLLRLPSAKEVTIVDGRVADGYSVWLFARNVLTKVIASKREEMATHLSMVIESVKTSSPSVALIYVDMLVEIVQNCTVDVLNNWEELESLFKCICHIRRDISVSLVRCLMPVLNDRPQLRQLLLQSVKGNLLNSRSANAVIPILMLLLRSFSERPNMVAESQMSQSFATFSSQSLQTMGCKRITDESVCLEVIGLLKRCLAQCTPTKTAVYLGFAEEGTRNSTMAGPCLDLLLFHAANAPEWKSETMVTVAGGVVFLVEPMPHLVQAMQCVSSDEVVPDGTQTQIDANMQRLIDRAVDIIDSWVKKASSEDVHNLAIDKLSEWNPTSPRGATNLLFAHMMLNLYDVLIEHVWSQFHKNKSVANADRITALLGRRKELDEVLQKKILGTAENALILDLKQADVLISAHTIAQILENVVPEKASSIEELKEVNCELLEWAIDRMVALSQSLLDGFHPLHTMLCGTKAMISAAGFLLDFYTDTDCADWIHSREVGCSSKTKALEAYGNILQYLSIKYRSQPIRIVAMWKKSDLNVTSIRGTQKSLTANDSLVRHCQQFITNLFPALLAVDRGVEKKKKRIGLELERQANIMLKICSALMRMMDDPECFMTMFKFTTVTLKKNIIGNDHTLREFLKWLSTLAAKCMDMDHSVERALNTIADDLKQVLSRTDGHCKYKFVKNASRDTVCDFLASSIDESLVAVQAVISFAGSFQAKDQRMAVFAMDDVLNGALTQCDQCCKLTARILPLHVRFAIQRERLVQTLTTLFSAVQEPVDLMLSKVKAVPKMVEWKSLAMLSKLVKKELHAIMATADEHLGILSPEESKGCKKNVRRIYMKYVKAREALQSRVLLISDALKEDRLNFQIKKNTIGMREFRINLDTLRTRVVQNEEEEQPKKKKRRATQSMERPTRT